MFLTMLLTCGLTARPTFHESSVSPAVVVEVSAMDVSQAVVSQLGGVTQTLQDGVHETLEITKRENHKKLSKRRHRLSWWSKVQCVVHKVK